MKPYEWMLEFTPQTEWIEGRGIFLWLAFYVGGLGGGLYLVALYFDNFLGILISWFIVLVLKGGFHLIYLGHPFRFWRMFFRPQTSWISRGLYFVALFLALVPLQLLLAYFAPGTGLEVMVKLAALVMAVGMSIYTGLVMNYMVAIQLWNSALLPVLFFFCGLAGGFGLMLGIGHFQGGVDMEAIETGSTILITAIAALIAIYLTSARYVGSAGKQSVAELLRGRVAYVFWLGVVLCGIIIPSAISLNSLLGRDTSDAMLLTAIVCEIVGGLTLRYALLKGGFYQPLLPITLY